MVKCVVFDIGHTLHEATAEDNEKGHKENVRLLRKLGYRLTYIKFKSALDSAWSKRNEIKRRKDFDLSQQILVELGIPFTLKLAKELTDSFFETRLKMYLKKKISKDISSTFLFLKKKKISVGIITNSDSSWSRVWLKSGGLIVNDELFIISHEVGTRKPFRKIFDLFYSRLKKTDPMIKRNEILMVGDRDKDLAAKRAGFQTCWYNPTNKNFPSEWNLKPDYIICKFSELKKIVR